MSELFTTLLLEISTFLLIPDILLLLFFSGMIVVYSGGILSEAYARWRHRARWLELIKKLKQEPDYIPSPLQCTVSFGLPAIALRELRLAPQAGDKIVDDIQLYAERLLSSLTLGVRLGPVLGLAGTLIPLGPALLALSTGDIQSLSSKLVVAFATTVLGLLIGGACYSLFLLRSRWYTQDLNDIEYFARRAAHATDTPLLK